MSNTKPNLYATANDETYGRQIAFTAAFILPAAKLLEAPSILAKYAAGDLLVPALLHFLLQGGLLLALLFAATGSDKTLFERLESMLGKGARVVYFFLTSYFVFSALLPLLDLEKYVYAAFFDTAPTSFSFAMFFLLSAFICMKGLKTVGRSADICLFLFLLPFLALLGMSVFETDFTHLLPLFGTKFGDSMYAFTKTTPHFNDALFLLPLIGNYRHKKGDIPKIMAGYSVGSFLTLFFLAVFFGLFSSIAAREHYAFSKIAQYFPALKITGRIDLVFIYALTVVLLFYTCFLLQYATSFFCRGIGTQKKLIPSAVLNFGLFLFVLFFNRRYNALYALISGKLFWIFWLVAAMLPLFFLLPKNQKEDNRA
ncbi:MAG: GerAB/ArcD/ProY family transporter [Clostridia bacterium]|nr:GerAB/ArcD/ProY family transporter [Clostridia bacterium]